jgi:AcrR family transcriptional regulator
LGSRERRERERGEVRRRILDAARELFTEKGYEAVTMRELAARIDYSATALYFHFKDKETLFRELCELDFRAFGAMFAEAAAVGDPVARLRALGLAYVAFAERAPNHYRLLFMTPHPHEHPLTERELAEKGRGDPTQDAYALLRITVEQAIAAGLLREELTDPDLVAQVLWGCVHGIVALRVTMGHERWVEWRPARRAVEALMDTVMRGMARAPAAPSATAPAAARKRRRGGRRG